MFYIYIYIYILLCFVDSGFIIQFLALVISQQHWLLGFNWSLSDSRSPQVSLWGSCFLSLQYAQPIGVVCKHRL